MRMTKTMNTRKRRREIRMRTTTKVADLSLYLDDMLMEILKRFDAKTLLRFRCVCKLWNYTIRQCYFANLHHNFSRNRVEGVIIICSFYYTRPYHDPSQQSRSNLYFYAISEQGEVNDYLNINASDIGFRRIDEVSEVVNGLVCINNYNRVVVCNISTREVIRLPKTRNKNYAITSQNPGTNIRTKFVPYYSLGFDPLTKAYKVIRIWVNKVSEFIQCELFTLGTSKRWRKIDDMPTNVDAIQTKSIYIRGSLYWLDHQLVKFVFQNEKFTTIDVPESISNFTRGTLYYPIQVEGRFAIRSLNCIYILDEVKQVWARKDFDIGKTMPVGSSETKLFFLQRDDQDRNQHHPTTLNLLRFDHNGHDMTSTKISGSFPFSTSLLLRMPSTTMITEHVENIYPLIRM